MATAVDPKAITRRQQQIWAAGDFARVASTNILPAEDLCEALDLRPGERVLDVAAGTGNAALAAARRWCDVTATDFVPALLETARRRAAGEGFAIQIQVADAQNLPFPDGSFDVVLSTFGVMFAPDQDRAAAELLRVCRPGGRIGLANWTPDGMIGEQMRIGSGRAAPPPGLRSPLDWGTEAGVLRLLGTRIEAPQLAVREQVFRYRSPEHMLEFLRAYFGPTKVAFDTLDTAAQASLAAEFLAVLRRYNRADDGTLIAPAAYLEIIAPRSQ